jgi:3',5'-cyclic AMP phosphodiesterase CpdA
MNSVENLKTKQSHNSVRETRQKVKEQYDSLYNQVAEILYRNDPAYLAICGVPTDEYAGEAGRILPQLKNAKSVLEARKIIYNVFDRSFNYGWSGTDLSKIVRVADDQAGVETDYQLIAEEVWTVWEMFKLTRKEDW